MDKTSIEWCDATFNPVSGCTRVSAGCQHCFAETIAARFSKPGQAYHGLATMTASGPRWTGEVKLHPERLGIPFRWKDPRRIFTCSMADLFHPAVPFDFVDKVFAVMALAPRHTFQILTKRPERMAAYVLGDRGSANADETPAHRLMERQLAVTSAACAMQVEHSPVPVEWPMKNVWLGTSCEDQKAANERIPWLLQTPAAVRFLSCEPLIGPIDLHETGDVVVTAKVGRILDNIHWVICGGESGRGARPCEMEWLRGIVSQCKAEGVPVFVKQLGAHPHEKRVASDGQVRAVCRGPSTADCRMDRRPRRKDAKGGDPLEMPADLLVREFPASSQVVAVG